MESPSELIQRLHELWRHNSNDELAVNMIRVFELQQKQIEDLNKRVQILITQTIDTPKLLKAPSWTP